MSNILTITFDASMLDVTVDGKVYQLDIAKPIPNESLVSIFAYGLQRKVNDACGGKDKDAAKKAELATAKIAAIYDGTIAERVRTAGPAELPIMFYVREIIRSKLGEKSKAEYKALTESDAKRDYIMAKFEAIADESVKAAILAQAQEKLDAVTAAAKRVKAMEIAF